MVSFESSSNLEPHLVFWAELQNYLSKAISDNGFYHIISKVACYYSGSWTSTSDLRVIFDASLLFSIFQMIELFGFTWLRSVHTEFHRSLSAAFQWSKSWNTAFLPLASSCMHEDCITNSNVERFDTLPFPYIILTPENPIKGLPSV